MSTDPLSALLGEFETAKADVQPEVDTASRAQIEALVLDDPIAVFKQELASRLEGVHQPGRDLSRGSERNPGLRDRVHPSAVASRALVRRKSNVTIRRVVGVFAVVSVVTLTAMATLAHRDAHNPPGQPLRAARIETEPPRSLQDVGQRTSRSRQVTKRDGSAELDAERRRRARARRTRTVARRRVERTRRTQAASVPRGSTVLPRPGRPLTAPSSPALGGRAVEPSAAAPAPTRAASRPSRRGPSQEAPSPASEFLP